MNLLQNKQFIHVQWHTNTEIQRGIPPVYKFAISLLDNVAHLGLSWEDVSSDIADDASLFGFSVGGKEFGEADFALAGHEDYEMPPDGGGVFGGRHCSIVFCLM
mmetsp:Transcript_9997/g.12607  ORF Transcript_9997/g.12607 Transcript_9997/m.12607 type:complete len:104 (+) Transcript_9997:540-851(+)